LVDVLEDLEVALLLDAPAVEGGTTITMDLPTLTALATIVDLRQEDLLLAVLHRGVPPRPEFDAKDLLACFERSPTGPDLNWTVRRLRMVSPVPVQATEDGMTRALLNLQEQGFVNRVNGRYVLAESIEPLVLSLGHCRGMGALSSHRLNTESPEEGSWTHRHVVFFRSLTGFTVLDFEKPEGDEVSVTLSGGSGAAIRETLEDILSLPAEEFRETAAQEPSRDPGPPPTYPPPDDGETPAPEAATPPDPDVGFCVQCGDQLRPGLSFCTKCGMEVRLVEESSDES
jgi:hypothetical protein